MREEQQVKAGVGSDQPNEYAGAWSVLSDNEGFLHSAAVKKAHKGARVKLWHIPARSPDLNPVEKFWSWLRRTLRARDLEDAKANRPVPGKMAYRRRVLNICQSRRAQIVAGGCAKSLRKTCLEVVAKNGAASRG